MYPPPPIVASASELETGKKKEGSAKVVETVDPYK